MTTQHKAILAAAALTLFGVSSAHAQATSTNTSAHGSQTRAQTERTNANEAKSEKRSTGTTLTFAERTLMQERLRDQGFYKGEIDGRMGEPTRRALEAFQRKHGLMPSGRPTGPTLSALGIMPSLDEAAPTESTKNPASDSKAGTTAQTSETTRAPASPPQTEAAARPRSDEALKITELSSAQTRAIQEKLRRLGFYQGEINGVAGASTQRALSDYYASQAELARQGKLRADSASTFNMRSDIQPVRGEEPRAKKAPSTSPRTMERGLDNIPRNEGETRMRE